jgi:hypothetical protein
MIGLLLAAFAVQDVPRHDKYREDPKAYCFHGTPEAAMPSNPSAHPCSCKLMCLTDGNGQRFRSDSQECEMNCTLERCLCHPEETCDVAEVKP